MELKRLLEAIAKPVPAAIRGRCPVRGLTDDSRRVREGVVFVALKGPREDGHRFLPQAIENKAAALVVSDRREVPRQTRGIPVVVVRDTHQALATLADVYFGHPYQKVKCVGITGTNGKTTVSLLVRSVLETAGLRCGVIGTIGYQTRRRNRPLSNTTPGILELHHVMEEMVRAGNEYVAMEVSSHALAQERVEGIAFSGAIFTNLTRDHLDYHRTMGRYFEAKKRLFTRYASAEASLIINTDDPYGAKLFAALKNRRRLSYGFSTGAQCRVESFCLGRTGSCARLKTPAGTVSIDTALVGRHNLYNILAAVAFGVAQGLRPKEIEEGIEKVRAVCGRLERVDSPRGFSVFVDYAHTDDALKNVLESLRAIAHNGRIITVFGCGGDRDKGKRPKMGRVAASLSDLCIVTSDNPRGEDPQEIIRQIVQGLRSKNVIVEPDRRRAIERALSLARKGDLVLVAGKGHETYQIIADRKLPFDDKAVVKTIIRPGRRHV